MTSDSENQEQFLKFHETAENDATNEKAKNLRNAVKQNLKIISKTELSGTGKHLAKIKVIKRNRIDNHYRKFFK